MQLKMHPPFATHASRAKCSCDYYSPTQLSKKIVFPYTLQDDQISIHSNGLVAFLRLLVAATANGKQVVGV